MTFKDIYETNGWILNITVTDSRNPENQRLLNYITDPDVIIWSAVCASCSIPEFFGEQKLFKKNPITGCIEEYFTAEVESGLQGNCRFIDGSISQDIPVKRISELFNVNTYLVSQVNPHGIPLVWNLNGKVTDNIYQSLILKQK